jgi:hypothetical protein
MTEYPHPLFLNGEFCTLAVILKVALASRISLYSKINLLPKHEHLNVDNFLIIFKSFS